MTDAALEPGSRLGQFRIVDRLGAGGMGEVYRALDERLKRDVALKVLPLETVADPAARARLLREARSAAALSHPHVCMVHEVGEDSGRDFIAMEWVDGQSLDYMVRAGGLPAATVVRIGAEIADALAHAHGRGVVHRDLKSANVMLSSDGRVKVLDFGLARMLSTPDSSTLDGRGMSLTEPGAIVGTTHYMAPEVLRGAEADARADIWALGVVLYELASGEMPFDGHTRFEVASAIMHSAPRPLPDAVPAGLRAVIARCLEKEPARRYQGAGEVRAILETASASGSLTFDPWTSSKSAERKLPSSGARKWPAVPRAGLVAGVLAGLVLTAVLVVSREPLVKRFFHAAVAAPIRALAILPLENLSRDPAQAYFAAGMTDAISDQLTKIASLRVIAQGSVAGLIEKHKSLADIGRELHVPVLLRGSVVTDSAHVRVTMQLVRAATGELLWSENYDRSQRDVLALQSEVALAIAQQIRVKLTPDEKTRLAVGTTVDPEAYRAFLKGRAILLGKGSLEEFQEAEQQFRHALELTPDYAPAWAGLADVIYEMSSTFVAANEAMPRSRAAVEKALALDPNLAEAHTVNSKVKLVYDWDWDGAEKEVDHAIELQPGNAAAHSWRGHLLVLRGRFDEGLAAQRRGLDLDPLSSVFSAVLGWHLYHARRYDEALAHLRAGVAVDPRLYYYYSFLGLTREQQGDHAEAIRELEKAVGMETNNYDLVHLAHAYGTAGRRSDFDRIMKQIMARREHEFMPAANIAYAYAGMGERDAAFHWLDLAFDDHSEMLTLLKVDPGFDPLRSDPRFDRVLRRVHLLD